MTLKNFWAHRKQNGWLIVELALICFLSYFFIDNAVVVGYNTYICRADGEFEKEHLLVGQIGFCGQSDQSDEFFAPAYAVRNRVRSMPEVESVCLTKYFVGHNYQSNDKLFVCAETDTVTNPRPVFLHEYVLGEHYFETLGLKAVEGSPSVETLSEWCPNDSVIISRSLAIALFGTDQAVGRRIIRQPKKRDGEWLHQTVAGIIEDVKVVENQRYFYSIYIPTRFPDNTPHMLIRLKPNADAKAFVTKYGEVDTWIREGNGVLTGLKTYNDYKKSSSVLNDTTAIMTLVGAFLFIFMLNVVIGTLGTYWLQIRKRTEDFGIMRSFGAKRRNIFGMIWKEAALLTLIASIIGQLLWLQIALKFGLADGSIDVMTGRETDWVNNFWLHFLIICVIQYLVMLVIVTLGIIIPALIAMYRKPVNALRHE